MRNRLRLFFLSLLIVSLPMQGIAGVTRLECGMSHHPAGDGNVLADDMPVSGTVHDTTHEASHETSHETSHEAASHEHDATAMLDAGQSDPDCDSDHQRSACGSCPACGLGAAAPPPVLAGTAVEEAVSSLQQFSLSSFPGHIPSRIERPPRAS